MEQTNPANMSDPNFYNNCVKFIKSPDHEEPISLQWLIKEHLPPMIRRKLPGDDMREYPLFDTLYWISTLSKEVLKNVKEAFKDVCPTTEKLIQLFDTGHLKPDELFDKLEVSMQKQFSGIQHPSIGY